MTLYFSRLSPLGSLEQVLPPLLSSLSIARAQIAVDQIRVAIGSADADKIVLVTAHGREIAVDETLAGAAVDIDSTAEIGAKPEASAFGSQEMTFSSSQPLAAAIAILLPDSSNNSGTATIVHAGSLLEVDAATENHFIDAIGSTLDIEFQRRQVGFCQWATDLEQSLPANARRWCQGLGYKRVGTLDYLTSKVPVSSMTSQPSPLDAIPLTAELLDWQRPGELEKLANLVERTYVETLDCPALSKYRSALQTVNDYQTSTAFDPSLWFRLIDASGVPVGCMILGRHLPPESTNQDDSARSNTLTPVLEIVYMGLVPEARGNGVGEKIVADVFARAQQFGGQRVILAVDQDNTPARSIYLNAGFEQLLSETVWVKSIGQSDG